MHTSVTPLVVKCLKPVLRLVDPNFNLAKMHDEQTLFGNLVPAEGEIPWLDSHHIPHVDIRWDIGVGPGGKMPKCYASVISLSDDWTETGTAVWVEKGTSLSVLKTVDENSNAQVFSCSFLSLSLFANLLHVSSS